MKKLVSIQALTARLNRKLAKESKKLLKYKPRLQSNDPIVEYEIVDLKTNTVVNYHTASELQELAKRFGCLASLEEVSFE
jgi:hypothetical protein